MDRIDYWLERDLQTPLQSQIMSRVSADVYCSAQPELDHTSAMHLDAHLLLMDFVTGRADDADFFYLTGFFPDLYPRASYEFAVMRLPAYLRRLETDRSQKY